MSIMVTNHKGRITTPESIPQRKIMEAKVRQNDVLFGRGSNNNNHNKQTVWRSYVDHPHFKTNYQHHPFKDNYAKQILALVRANSKPPARFLVPTNDDGSGEKLGLVSWCEANENDVIEKTKRKLREKCCFSSSLSDMMTPPGMMFQSTCTQQQQLVCHIPFQSAQPNSDMVAPLCSTGGGGGSFLFLPSYKPGRIAQAWGMATWACPSTKQSSSVFHKKLPTKQDIPPHGDMYKSCFKKEKEQRGKFR